MDGQGYDRRKGDGTVALEQRVDRLERALERLAEAQAQTQGDLRILTARVDALAAAMAELVAQVSRLTGEFGALKGRVLEADYREKAHSYFARILLATRSVPRNELSALAADAERRAILSTEESVDLMQADVVVRGWLRDRNVDGYLLAEVSSVIDARDVQRAARRAGLLHRIVGVPVVAAVAGEHITPEADQEASAADVWRVLDGRAFPPGSQITQGPDL